MKKIRNRISQLVLIGIIGVLGFLTGIFTIALWQENWLITEGILNQNYLSKIEELIIDKRALFFLCLEKRLCAFFLLFLLSFSTVNVVTNAGFFFLHGLYIGSVLELPTRRQRAECSVSTAQTLCPSRRYFPLMRAISNKFSAIKMRRSTQ